MLKGKGGGCDGRAKAQAAATGALELPHVRGQGQQRRVPDCDGAGTAERSNPMSEVGGGGGRPRGVTPGQRSGVAAGRRYPTPLSPRPGVVCGRSYPTPPRLRSGAVAGRTNPTRWLHAGTGGPRGAIPC